MRLLIQKNSYSEQIGLFVARGCQEGIIQDLIFNCLLN